MKILESWYKECTKIFRCDGYDFALVRGFKITHYLDDDTYTIQDTRKNDFYTSVSESDMDILMEYGFINGTSIIMHYRNINRVEYYLGKIEKLYSKMQLAKKKIKTDRKFYEKQIRNCKTNIQINHDMVHFYQSKLNQFEDRFLELTKTKENE